MCWRRVRLSASGAYMAAQSALPFANPGHLRGLTLQRLFKKVLATGAPHLFMSSFNGTCAADITSSPVVCHSCSISLCRARAIVS